MNYFLIIIALILSNLALATNSVDTGYFNQRLDHSKIDSGTFLQKYYLYTHPEANLNSPVFYMLGNEHEISPMYLTGTVMKVLADSFKGYAVVLEHRFYGESIPFKNLENSNLRLLTTEQALNDFAHFQVSLTNEKKLSGKWISIGSSYAGNLSAYYRLKNPHLVAGAIVSSAPLKTPRFNRLMDNQVVKELGPQCLRSYQERISEIKNNLQDPTYRKIFNQKTGSEKIVDDRTIFFTIADLLTIIAQRGLTQKACVALESKPALEGLVAALEVATGPSLNLYQNSLEVAFETTTSVNGNIQLYRQWYYQACTEYGFWQLPSKQKSHRFRDTSVNKNYYKWFCKKAYGVKMRSKNYASFENYLSQITTGTNLNMLMINGLRDPWAQLSHASSSSERGLEVLNLDKGVHGTGIGAPRPNEAPDSPGVLARNLMVLYSQKWIAK